jgi:hypothetical protein
MSHARIDFAGGWPEKRIMRRLAILIVSGVLLASCVSSDQRRSQPSPWPLAARPAHWKGERVELEGLVVWESETSGLYRSYEDYCARKEGRGGTAIAADWGRVRGITERDNRRLAIVLATFRDRIWRENPDGTILISTRAPGPGALEDISLLRWLSRPMPDCAD